MPEMGVRLVIEAENRAMPALAEVQAASAKLREEIRAGNEEALKFDAQLAKGRATAQDLVTAYGSAAHATQQLQQAHTQAAAAASFNFRETRLLAGIMSSELTPAMGGVESALIRVATMTTALASGTAALSILAAGLGATLIGQVVVAYEAVAKSMREFQQAAQANDLSALAKGVQEYSDKIRQLGTELSRAAELKQQLDVVLSPDVTGEARGWADITSGYRAASRDTAVAELRRRAIIQQGAQLQAGITEGEAGVLGITGQQEAFRLGTLRQDRGLYDWRLTGPQAAYEATLRQAADRTGAGDSAGAARLRAGGASRYDLEISALQAPHLDVFAPTSFMSEEERAFAIGRAAVTDIRREQARQTPAWPGYSPEEIARYVAGETETASQGFRIGEGGAREIRSVTSQRLGLDVQALQISGRMPGLSDLDRAGIVAGELSLRTQRLDRNDPNYDRNARNLDLERTLLGAQTRAISDPATGAALGFKQVADAGNEWGKQMTDLATKTATTMQQAFATGFFDVITGNFKDLPNVARQFSEQLVREVLTSFSRIVTAPLFNTLANALGGGGSGTPFGSAFAGAAVVSGGAAAGTMAMPFIVSSQAAAAQAQAAGYSIVTTTAGQVVAVPPSTPGLSIPSVGPGTLNDFTSGTAVGDFLKTPIFQQPTRISADTFYQQALASGADPAEARDIAAQAYLAQDPGTLPGLTVGSALGIGLGAAAFGFTLYSAFTGPPTAKNIATSAVSGALTGASLGASIAVAFGAGAGVGGVYGAIAGALLAAGAAALGKGGEDDKAKAQRQQREIDRVGGQIKGVLTRINQSKTIDELFAYLKQRAPGGPSDTGWVQTIDVNGARKPLSAVTLAEFTKYIDSLSIAIQAGIDVNLLIQWNRTMEEAIKFQVAGFLDQSKRGVYGYKEQLSGPGLAQGGIERLTLLTGEARLGEAAGQDILVSTDVLRLLGMDDNGIEQLLRKLKDIDRNHDVGVLPEDELVTFIS